MINLLPPHQKEQLKKEYTLRLVSVYLLLLAIAVIIGTVLLLPAYFTADIENSFAQKKIAELKTASETDEREEINEQILVTKEKLNALTKTENRIPFHEVVSEIAEYAGQDITLTNISYTRAFGENESSMNVGGKALTRESLLLFEKTLEASDVFNEVILPVSILAKDEDIKFNIEIKGMY